MIKEKILVVEDERALSEAIRLFLEMSNFQVFTADNGNDAIKIIKGEERIDLILCDINLPDITGHDILAMVKSNTQTSEIPFIFLSAYSDEKDIKQGMAGGATDYMTKPFSSKELVKRIKGHLANAQGSAE